MGASSNFIDKFEGGPPLDFFEVAEASSLHPAKVTKFASTCSIPVSGQIKEIPHELPISSHFSDLEPHTR